MRDNDITCQKGSFLLEEWIDAEGRQHCFYKNDKPLTDEKVVYLLADLEKENKELKQKVSEYDLLKCENAHMRRVLNENEELKKELRSYKPVIFDDEEKGKIILYKGGIGMTDILCESCRMCVEELDDDMVKCDVKGIVDVHSICNYYIEENKE